MGYDYTFRPVNPESKHSTVANDSYSFCEQISFTKLNEACIILKNSLNPSRFVVIIDCSRQCKYNNHARVFLEYAAYLTLCSIVVLKITEFSKANQL